MKRHILYLLCMVATLVSTVNAVAFYNPSTGRWLSRDPIEEKAGVNLYAFLCNYPVSRIDPFGLYQLYLTVDLDWFLDLGFDYGLSLVFFDSNNIENIGLYETFGTGVGVNVGASAGAGIMFGDNTIDGDTRALDVNLGAWSPTAAIPAAGDLALVGFQLTYGPGEGASGSYDRTESVFTANTLKGWVYRAIFEGKFGYDD